MPALAIAHRGASGHAHENSPTAFRRAVALGADGVELDIHATSDGEVILPGTDGSPHHRSHGHGASAHAVERVPGHGHRKASKH